MTSKYEPLAEFLAGAPDDKRDITLSFLELEKFLGFSLPKSAVDYRQWWENPSNISGRSQAEAWRKAEFRVDIVKLKKLGGWVRFQRG